MARNDRYLLQREAVAGLKRLSPNEWSAWAFDPIGFSRRVLGHHVTDGQAEVLQSVVDHRVTVVKSANAVGKTFIAADVGVWFFRCLTNSKIVSAAAPPLDNLQRLLWGEVDQRVMDHPELFNDCDVHTMHIAAGPNWWFDGVAIPTSGSSAEREAKFAGKHAPFLLFIIDEGDAVPEEVYRGIESCMSGGFARLLVMFNPRSKNSPAYKLITQGAHVVTLDAFSHPNVITGETVIPGGAVTRRRTIRRIEKWSRPVVDGEKFDEAELEYFKVPDFLADQVGAGWRKVEDPQLSYIVLARFPGQSLNQLIPESDVTRAMGRWKLRQELVGDQPPGIAPLVGLDIAEFGADFNCLCKRYGGWVAPLELWNGIDPNETAKEATMRLANVHPAAVAVDAVGVGAGVAPRMREEIERIQEIAGLARSERVPFAETQVLGVKVSWKSPPNEDGVTAYYDLRAYLFDQVRRWLHDDPTAMLPPDDQLAQELTAIQYENKGGVRRITPKDKMRDSLGRSPDKADALALSFALEGDNAVLMGWV
jgi:hypothetical protein